MKINKENSAIYRNVKNGEGHSKQENVKKWMGQRSNI